MSPPAGHPHTLWQPQGISSTQWAAAGHSWNISNVPPWDIRGYHMGTSRHLHGHPEDTAMASLQQPRDAHETPPGHPWATLGHHPTHTTSLSITLLTPKTPPWVLPGTPWRQEQPLRHPRKTSPGTPRYSKLGHTVPRGWLGCSLPCWGWSQHSVALGPDPVPRTSPCSWLAPAPTHGRAHPRAAPRPCPSPRCAHRRRGTTRCGSCTWTWPACAQ